MSLNDRVFVGGDPINRVDSFGLFEQNPYHQKRIDRFNDWYNSNENTSWTKDLPACPSKIDPNGGNPKNCNGSTWSPISEASPTFHPDAKWCMRSKGIRGPGQQCCYDCEGNLLPSDNFSAGTPDIEQGKPGNYLGYPHWKNDVRPYRDAEILDSAPGSKGGYVKKYFEVRPPSSGGGKCN